MHIMLIMLFAVAAEPAVPAEKAAGYQAAVRTCLDNLIEHGQDRYGPVHTPMWMSVIDVRTNEAPQHPEVYDSEIRTEGRQHRRNPGGCDVWDHQPALRAAYALSELTGDKKYGDAADAFAKSFMERAQLPHGLLSWGSHIYYDAYTDKPAGDSMAGRVGPHEILVALPVWDRLWALNPDVVRQEIEAFWEWHVVDKQTGRHNRHDDKSLGCDFAFSGGEIACAQAFLYSKTGDAQYLERARTVAEYHWNARNRETNLAPDAPGLTDRYDGHHCFTTVPGPHASLLLKCFEYTGDPWFKETALAHIKAYLKYGWDDSAGRWWGMVALDGKPVPQEEKGADYDAYKPTGYVDIWTTSMFSYEFPVAAAQTALYAHGLTGDADALEAARNWARNIRAELPPKQGRRWADEMRAVMPDLDREGDSNAENYGRAISFFLRLHPVTRDPGDLETAIGIADQAMARLYENGWFKGHPRKPFYETADNVGYLLYALLELSAYPKMLAPNL
ncbi:MAG TPA: hypothetical protein VMZ06_13630 [Candidatus Bathyarchaeia archaeon]|nr:hypothetical protein [Candidatus Bathyarchaeia archaeon]